MRTLGFDLDTLASVYERQAVCLLGAFGSTVRDLRRPDSDLDLAVWMATANTAPQALVSLEVALRPLFPGERLDLVLLNRASPLLQFVEYLTALTPLQELSYTDYLQQPLSRYAAERLLQLLIDTAVDINAHLIVELTGTPPQDYYDSFIKAAQGGVILFSCAYLVADASTRGRTSA